LQIFLDHQAKSKTSLLQDFAYYEVSGFQRVMKLDNGISATGCEPRTADAFSNAGPAASVSSSCHTWLQHTAADECRTSDATINDTWAFQVKEG